MYRAKEFMAYYPEAKKHSVLSSQGWWLNQWLFLGWLETVLKVCAFLFAYYVPQQEPVVDKWQHSALRFRNVEIFLFGICTVLITVAIVDRLFYREVISIIFVIPNNWVHWRVFLALWRGHYVRKWLIYFLSFFVLGDVVKLLFFRVYDFNIGQVAKVASSFGSNTLLDIYSLKRSCITWFYYLLFPTL
eukprot:jgi/Galph1/4407/GphlegSOOS_G3061.1